MESESADSLTAASLPLYFCFQTAGSHGMRDRTPSWRPTHPTHALWVCLVLASGCAAPSIRDLPIVGGWAKSLSGNSPAGASDVRQASYEPVVAAASSGEIPERLPAVDAAEATPTLVLPAEEIRPGTKPLAVDGGSEIDSCEVHSIDLLTALRLADAGNLQIAFAREQIEQSFARVSSADVLWLPSLRGGSSYNKHEGQIQDTAGTISDVSRNQFFTGFGAGANAAASPMFPGVYANFQLADAVFQPLAERQAAAARQQAAAAATNDVLLKVAAGYLELVRTAEDFAIAREARQYAQQLADLTGAYAESGEGLQSDAERALAELAVRRTIICVPKRRCGSFQLALRNSSDSIRLCGSVRSIRPLCHWTWSVQRRRSASWWSRV